MEFNKLIIEKLKEYGVGRRKLDDELFAEDKPPPRLGVYDVDEENLCHEVIKSTCSIPGCTFTSESLLEYENHYNTSHRYSCSQCKKVLPSPHLLDLHIQETHDSFFSVMATRKPSYCCYIEECKDKFMNPEERLDHCVKIHKIPKDFRFDQRPKKPKNKTKKVPNENSMEMDTEVVKDRKFKFNNNKQKGFVKYTGRKFTNDEEKQPKDVNMDEAMEELKESLPV